ncbi:telomerase-binding protein EST1A isoform X2 [Fopius arisanus]|uniref:Telomerase-binding protein EST1A isoform X2 n=2 Tax=Fopius arisanus TaxID=64838 RepID=A0A9R1U3X6_9HYME|nr:PREDICTED: telomerase-binding protein EST1A-like isoform X2 [Fopius arisanus]
MANHDKGRRKWGGISQDNSDSKIEKDRSMGGRGGGPRGPQLLYTPGSGPLKKTGRQCDDYANDPLSHHEERRKPNSVQDRLKVAQYNNTNHSQKSQDNLADEMNDIHINYKQNNDQGKGNHFVYSRKRNKKPEQQLYVPKKVQEALAERDVTNRSPVQQNWERPRDREDWDTQSSRSHRSSRSSRPSDPRPSDHPQKRFPLRRNRNPSETDDSWRPESPRPYQNHQNHHRNMRQGSEPPSSPQPSQNHQIQHDPPRIRDTRSVEPSYDKFPRKPPLGRRHLSKVKFSRLECLPPRLQRKHLAENGIDLPPPNPENYPQIHHQTYSQSHYPSNSPTAPPPPQQWSNTIPIRSRGRGRLRQDDLESQNHRPTTPDQYSAPSSRSHTPSQELMTRSYERRGSNSTMYTSMESLSRMDLGPPSNSSDNYRRAPSPVVTKSNNNFDRQNSERDTQNSTGNPNEAFHSLPDTPTGTLDWSEEVELSERLENERLSRSSSISSFRETASVSGHSSNATISRNRSQKKKRRERRRSRGDRSNSRDKTRGNSHERVKNQQNENDNYNNNQNSGARRYDRRIGNRNIMNRSRESSKDRGFTRIRNENTEANWRTGKRISICESDDGKRAPLNTNINTGRGNSPVRIEGSTPGVLVLPEQMVSPPVVSNRIDNRQPGLGNRRTLFDPNNPNKPIEIVPSPGSRASGSDSSGQFPGQYVPSNFQQSLQVDGAPPTYIADQLSNSMPSWYDPSSESLRSAKNPCLLLGIETMDRELHRLLTSGGITTNWDRVAFLRHSLQQSLQTLLETDMKFCQAENVEQHFWKILFYNIIEMLRKIVPKEGPAGKELCKRIMLKIIDDGTGYFENLLTVLETNYKFKLEAFLSSSVTPKGLGFVGLALISAQKIFLFLGDLARYKEQANETTNYGKSRQWYLKAQQINPKNGRPYNQLALLAHYARRKLDAVYYYMRSLMASNPLHSARESLIALFDENRKKYESTERKRKEEREWKERARMKEKEGANNLSGGLRRETWIHPGGRRMRRTTSAASTAEAKLAHSDLEELAQLSSVEVNKRFVTSYLHVHGKLITKIGMETFQEAGIQMLREFRALLQHSPLPLPGTRLLQLLALNMFAIETTQLKDSQMEQGYRSEVQERALVVSLQMFNLILERGVSLLKEQLENQVQPRLVVGDDMQVLLPAIKIWCDWMLCHSSVWNPPPSCTDYRVGSPGDAWSRLAVMVNLLEKLPYPRNIVIQSRDATGRENELNLVKLPEDSTLSGFTPLMSNPQEPFYALKSEDMEVVQVCLRIHKILFFGQGFLCGLETPVLKLQKSETGMSEYVSLVETSSASAPSSPPEQSDSEILVDSYSEDDDGDPESSSDRVSSVPKDLTSPPEIRSLIERKEELERRQRKQERHRQRVQAILLKSSVSVEIEVRPRQLVPDTNCFIDYLSQLQSITRATSGAQPLFTLMIPLVVLNELEGLARGADPRDCTPNSRAMLNPEHVARVAESAKAALSFARSRNPAIRCLTTRGTVLSSSTFTVEEDNSFDGLTRNDDRILATCLSLCKSNNKDQPLAEEGQPRRLRREVVLLTEDRNLRVKALSRDVPVREVPDFIQWAGLG